MNLKSNHKRLFQSIDEISKYSLSDQPWTRKSFTPIYQKGRNWFAKQAQLVGAEVFYDNAGNLISRIKGNGKSNQTIMIGSHLDTVQNGGKFDGILGVLSGLEIARVIKENNISLNHNLEFVDFLAEEHNEFGLSCIGSRGLIGDFDKGALSVMNSDNKSLYEVINEFNGDSDNLIKGKPLRDDIVCFLEYHIEQGKVLESEQIDIGIVTSIVGLDKIKLEIMGESNHAGTTPINLRKDSMVCLSEIILKITQEVEVFISKTNDYLVATAGKVDIFPNATNVIAGRAVVTFDIRSDNAKTQHDFIKSVEDICHRVARKHNNRVTIFENQSDSKLVKCNDNIIGLFEEVTKNIGYSYKKMPSGAGHDCSFMAQFVPSAMIFCPSKGGISHSPNEYSSQDDIGKGCDVLLNTLIKVDQYFLDNK